jgi:N-methylhydantoinase A
VYEELTEELRAEVSDRERADVSCSADLRYAGQSFELTVDVDRPFDAEEAGERFAEAHESAYGYQAGGPVDLVNCRVTTTVPREAPPIEYAGSGEPQKDAREAAFVDGIYETPVYERDRLAPGGRIDGPAIVEGDESTIVVPPAWDVQVRDDGALIAEVDSNG